MNSMPCVFPFTTLNSVEALPSYLNHVNSIPVLSAKEEKALFERFQHNNDLDAARQIIMSHLRFVVYIAKSYTGYGLPLEDLIQEGNVGLMKSVKRFELSYGVRLVTFAVHWIKAEIHDYVLKNWRLVKVATTKAQRKLFFNLRKTKSKLGWLTRSEAEKIANALNVETSDVIEMESRLQQHDCFFDESFGDSVDIDSDSSTAKSVYLEDHTMRPDLLCESNEISTDTTKTLHAALDQLDDRSRDIITSRWFGYKKTGLKALSEKYGVSMERIRQIEAAAMKKMKQSLPESLDFASSAI